MCSRLLMIQQLKAYEKIWGDESAAVRRFIDFVASNPDCCDRGLDVGHVTGSAWVVNNAGTHVLLTHHRKLDKWFQLGGHADGDADILRVAKREVLEESGLDLVVPVSEHIFDLDIHAIPGRGKEPEHFHYDIRYALRATANEMYKVSEESHDLGWVEINRIEEKTNEVSMLRMASKWKFFNRR